MVRWARPGRCRSVTSASVRWVRGPSVRWAVGSGGRYQALGVLGDRHGEEEREWSSGESGHQEDCQALPVWNTCEENIQGAEDAEAYATWKRELLSHFIKWLHMEGIYESAYCVKTVSLFLELWSSIWDTFELITSKPKCSPVPKLWAE